MPARPCIGCGTVVRSGRRCPACQRRRRKLAGPRPYDDPRYRRNKKRALQRDRHRCVVCGATEKLEVHHRVPLAHGGSHALANLVTLCESHHHQVTAALSRTSR